MVDFLEELVNEYNLSLPKLSENEAEKFKNEILSIAKDLGVDISRLFADPTKKSATPPKNDAQKSPKKRVLRVKRPASPKKEKIAPEPKKVEKKESEGKERKIDIIPEYKYQNVKKLILKNNLTQKDMVVLRDVQRMLVGDKEQIRFLNVHGFYNSLDGGTRGGYPKDKFLQSNINWKLEEYYKKQSTPEPKKVEKFKYPEVEGFKKTESSPSYNNAVYYYKKDLNFDFQYVKGKLFARIYLFDRKIKTEIDNPTPEKVVDLLKKWEETFLKEVEERKSKRNISNSLVDQFKEQLNKKISNNVNLKEVVSVSPQLEDAIEKKAESRHVSIRIQQNTNIKNANFIKFNVDVLKGKYKLKHNDQEVVVDVFSTDLILGDFDDYKEDKAKGLLNVNLDCWFEYDSSSFKEKNITQKNEWQNTFLKRFEKDLSRRLMFTSQVFGSIKYISPSLTDAIIKGKKEAVVFIDLVPNYRDSYIKKENWNVTKDLKHSLTDRGSFYVYTEETGSIAIKVNDVELNKKMPFKVDKEDFSRYQFKINVEFSKKENPEYDLKVINVQNRARELEKEFSKPEWKKIQSKANGVEYYWNSKKDKFYIIHKNTGAVLEEGTSNWGTGKIGIRKLIEISDTILPKYDWNKIKSLPRENEYLEGFDLLQKLRISFANKEVSGLANKPKRTYKKASGLSNKVVNHLKGAKQVATSKKLTFSQKLRKLLEY